MTVGPITCFVGVSSKARALRKDGGKPVPEEIPTPEREMNVNEHVSALVWKIFVGVNINLSGSAHMRSQVDGVARRQILSPESKLPFYQGAVVPVNGALGTVPKATGISTIGVWELKNPQFRRYWFILLQHPLNKLERVLDIRLGCDGMHLLML